MASSDIEQIRVITERAGALGKAVRGARGPLRTAPTRPGERRPFGAGSGALVTEGGRCARREAIASNSEQAANYPARGCAEEILRPARGPARPATGIRGGDAPLRRNVARPLPRAWSTDLLVPSPDSCSRPPAAARCP